MPSRDLHPALRYRINDQTELTTVLADETPVVALTPSGADWFQITDALPIDRDDVHRFAIEIGVWADGRWQRDVAIRWCAHTATIKFVSEVDSDGTEYEARGRTEAIRLALLLLMLRPKSLDYPEDYVSFATRTLSGVAGFAELNLDTSIVAAADSLVQLLDFQQRGAPDELNLEVVHTDGRAFRTQTVAVERRPNRAIAARLVSEEASKSDLRPGPTFASFGHDMVGAMFARAFEDVPACSGKGPGLSQPGDPPTPRGPGAVAGI